MNWNQNEIKIAITKGLYNLHLSVNRPSTEKGIENRSENLIPIFDGWTAQKIEKFFEWMRMNYDKLPSDREIKLCSCQRSALLDDVQGAGGGYYGAWGEYIPNGTFVMVESCPPSQWCLRASVRAKELMIKANNDLLVGPEYQEWDSICKKRVTPFRGAIQKPIMEWDENDKNRQKVFVDNYNENTEKWNQYEQDLIKHNEGLSV